MRPNLISIVAICSLALAFAGKATSQDLKVGNEKAVYDSLDLAHLSRVLADTKNLPLARGCDVFDRHLRIMLGNKFKMSDSRVTVLSAVVRALSSQPVKPGSDVYYVKTVLNSCVGMANSNEQPKQENAAPANVASSLQDHFNTQRRQKEDRSLSDRIDLAHLNRVLDETRRLKPEHTCAVFERHLRIMLQLHDESPRELFARVINVLAQGGKPLVDSKPIEKVLESCWQLSNKKPQPAQEPTVGSSAEQQTVAQPEPQPELESANEPEAEHESQVEDEEPSQADPQVDQLAASEPTEETQSSDVAPAQPVDYNQQPDQDADEDKIILSRLDLAQLSQVRLESRQLSMGEKCETFAQELRSMLADKAPVDGDDEKLFSLVVKVLSKRKLPFNNGQPVLGELQACLLAARNNQQNQNEETTKRSVIAGPPRYDPPAPKPSGMQQAMSDFNGVKNNVKDFGQDLYKYPKSSVNKNSEPRVQGEAPEAKVDPSKQNLNNDQTNEQSQHLPEQGNNYGFNSNSSSVGDELHKTEPDFDYAGSIAAEYVNLPEKKDDDQQESDVDEDHMLVPPQQNKPEEGSNVIHVINNSEQRSPDNSGYTISRNEFRHETSNKPGQTSSSSSSSMSSSSTTSSSSFRPLPVAPVAAPVQQDAVQEASVEQPASTAAEEQVKQLQSELENEKAATSKLLLLLGQKQSEVEALKAQLAQLQANADASNNRPFRFDTSRPSVESQTFSSNFEDAQARVEQMRKLVTDMKSNTAERRNLFNEARFGSNFPTGRAAGFRQIPPIPPIPPMPAMPSMPSMPQMPNQPKFKMPSFEV